MRRSITVSSCAVVVTVLMSGLLMSCPNPVVTDSSYISTTIGTLTYVAGGSFNNGTALMTVSSFHMSQYEITGEQYVAVMGGSDPSSFASVSDNPVDQVNWYKTLVFCNKLSIAEGLTPVYTINESTNPNSWGAIPNGDDATWSAVTANWSADGYRLPTESEWQFAAMGGNNTHNYLYAGSNTIDDVAWYQGNITATTHTVGTKVANELGLYDMSGNVWEWCWDWYDVSYPATAETDYRGPDSGTSRVRRGGEYSYNAAAAAVDARAYNSPGPEYSASGFRVVRP